MYRYNNIYFICLISIFFCLLSSCAKQVVLSGGEIDTSPPIAEKCIPQNQSVNFNSPHISIKFNEYIKLNNINQKLIVSPPLAERPQVILKGKTIKIILNPKILQANTSYIFNFNDAIEDNNESNKLSNFIYAFSTGSELDSLNFAGYVLDALTKEAQSDIWVMLYNDLSDTAFRSLQPNYISKTDKNGKFILPYIKANNYKIYALKDNNFNYIYDLPEENIAFLDTIFSPNISKVKTETDSLSSHTDVFPQNIELLTFQEIKKNQYIKSIKRQKQNYIELIFNNKHYSYYNIDIVGTKDFIISPSTNIDTVGIWLLSDSLINSDFITIISKFSAINTFNDSIIIDTSKLQSLDKQRHADFKISVLKNTVFEKIQLKFSSPLYKFNKEKLKLIDMTDSSNNTSIDFRLQVDTITMQSLFIDAQFKENTKYKLILQDSFAVNFYNSYSKPDTISVTPSPTANYGNLHLTISDSTHSNYIVQLLQSDKVLYSQSSSSGFLSISYIRPAKYKIRIIEDLNNNGHWDTGSLKKLLQAEKVYYLKSEYEIRSNWTHELNWSPLSLPQDVKNN